MNKLIKISDIHYIIVDDSEIKEGDYCTTDLTVIDVGKIHNSYTIFNPQNNEHLNMLKSCKKITHSTQPLEFGDWENGVKGKRPAFEKIKPLSLSEVQELINGFSVEKMAEQETINNEFNSEKSYIKGFNAHKVLIKNKLFTVEDMDTAFEAGYNARHDERQSYYQSRDILIKSLLPKTEWQVEFDNQGKLKLL